MRRTEEQQRLLLQCIKSHYRYDAERGVLVNKRNAVVKGWKRAGYLRTNIFIDGKRHVVPLAYIVWAVTHDSMPAKQIDHINGNPKDNRIENLREVSRSENMMNRVWAWKPNTKTGLPGVCKTGGSFKIKFADKDYNFRDKFEAFYMLTMLGRMFRED